VIKTIYSFVVALGKIKVIRVIALPIFCARGSVRSRVVILMFCGIT
jgi:predicted ABC-type exoprotein transport system permease subunit